MSIIEFPNQNRRITTTTGGQKLNPTIETAVRMHDLIIESLRSAPFDENPKAIETVFVIALIKHFDAESARWAEFQFERLYGVDLYTFIDRLASYHIGA